MYARIEDETVIELVIDSYYDNLSEEDQAFYIPAPNDVLLGWKYKDNQFSSPLDNISSSVTFPLPITHKYARLEDNIVMEVYENNPRNLFSEDFANKFVKCPAEVLPRWTYDGNIFSPPVIPVIVPTEVTMRQARLALHAAGYLNTINSSIINAGPAATIEWEYSNTVLRTKQLVSSMQAILNLTDEDMDNLFIAASLID